MTCPSCKAEASVGKFCNECGAKLPTENLPDDLELTTEVTTQSLTPPKFETSMGHNLSVGSPTNGKSQEDAAATEEVLYPNGVKVLFLAVADGVGGDSNGGEVASSAVVHLAWAGLRMFALPTFTEAAKHERNELLMLINQQLAASLFNQVTWAHQCVQHSATAHKEQPDREIPQGDFRTTIAVAVLVCDLYEGTITIHGYHQGDTRLWLVTNGGAEQLTNDHMKRLRLSHWVGTGVGTLGEAYFTSEFNIADSAATVAIVGATDGLHNMISASVIADTVHDFANVGARFIARELTNLSITVENPVGRESDPRVEPGDDNIGVAVALFSAVKNTQPTETK